MNFIDLPKELVATILSEWFDTRGLLKVLHSMDNSFCSSKNRKPWLDILAMIRVPPFQELLRNQQRYNQAMVWAFSRKMKLQSSLSLDATIINDLCDRVDGQACKSAKELTIYSPRLGNGRLQQFGRFLDLFPSLQVLDISLWKDVTNHDIEILIERSPQLPIHTLILGSRLISPSLVAALVMQLRSTLVSFDGDFLVAPNCDEGVLRILEEECKLLSSVSFTLSTQVHDLFLSFITNCRGRLKKITLLGRIAGASSFGEVFVKQVALKAGPALEELVVDTSESQIYSSCDLQLWMMTHFPSLSYFSCAGQSYRSYGPHKEPSSSQQWNLGGISDPSEVFQAISTWKTPLKELNLNYLSCHINDWLVEGTLLRPSFRMLLSSAHVTSLRSLDLSFSQLEQNFYFPIFDLVSACHHLEQLRISACRCVCADSFQMLPMLASPTSPTSSSSSASLSLSFSHMHSLERLIIQDAVELSDSLLWSILQSTPALRLLSVRYCPLLTSAALCDVALHCPHLEELVGSERVLTEELCAVLETELPNCKISRQVL